jgi:hypothetical protein
MGMAGWYSQQISKTLQKKEIYAGLIECRALKSGLLTSQ